MPRPPPRLSLRSFAAAVDLSQKAVQDHVRAGLPIGEDGRIDVKAGKAWLAANLDPARRLAAGKGEGLANVADRRASKLDRENALLDLQLAQRRGELVERRAVEAAVFERARFERDSWHGWTARTATALAGELGADAALVFAALDRAVRDHLHEMSEASAL